MSEFLKEVAEFHRQYRFLIYFTILWIYFNRTFISRGLDVLTGQRPWPKRPKRPG